MYTRNTAAERINVLLAIVPTVYLKQIFDYQNKITEGKTPFGKFINLFNILYRVRDR